LRVGPRLGRESLPSSAGIKNEVTGESLLLSKHSETLSALSNFRRRLVNGGRLGTALEQPVQGGREWQAYLGQPQQPKMFCPA
jgi:hypothetical protein